jgi:hypothetical protein
MSKQTRVMVAVARALAWLLPAGRRDWAEAVWAEAQQVPPGMARLAWRAGGAWMLAREGLRPRRLGRVVVFAAAAALAAWTAWPKPGISHVTESEFTAIAMVVLLGLAPRFFGVASPSRAGRFLRVFCYAALLVFLAAQGFLGAFTGLVPRRAYQHLWAAPRGVPGTSTSGPNWIGATVMLVVAAGYVAVFLRLTSRRSQVTRGTLVLGTGWGLLFGVVMYVVAPLGLGNYATDPWLRGSEIDPLVVLAWVLLFGGPVAACVLAGRRCRRPDGSVPSYEFRIRQGIAAGVLASMTGALSVTAAALGTITLMIKSAWLRQWLYHSPHLTAFGTYSHEIRATQVGPYLFMCLGFPFVGLFMSSVAAAIANPAPRQPSSPPGNGGGPPGPGPEPGPVPPDGGRVDRVPVLALSGCTVFRMPGPPGSGLPMTDGE